MPILEITYDDGALSQIVLNADGTFSYCMSGRTYWTYDCEYTIQFFHDLSTLGSFKNKYTIKWLI